jgi:hypothetical protein
MEMSLSKMTIEEYREYFIDLMKCFHLLTNYRLICDCVLYSLLLLMQKKWFQLLLLVLQVCCRFSTNYEFYNRVHLLLCFLTIVFSTYEKLEDGNVKLQSRLEQEEEAKAALLARIQRLTKLILVSTKVTQTSRFSPHPGPRRRHSFGEEEVCICT